MSSGQNSCTKDSSASRIKRDEHDVKKVMETVKSWVDPFELGETSAPLSNIASGVEATEKIENDLLTAKETGRREFEAFVHKRLQSSEVAFHAPLQKCALKSFGDLLMKKQSKSASSDTIIKADRGLFAKMVVTAKSREMDMEEVLKYPLGPLPWSLATPDGAPAKPAKASLLHLLESEVEPAEYVPASGALVLDGMAIIHSISSVPKTFSELAHQVFQLVKSYAHQKQRVDLVMDQYPDISIKSPEHTRRGACGSLTMTIQGGNQKCPTQWKKFLCSGANKTQLASFLVNEWQRSEYVPRFAGLGILYVTHGSECHMLVPGDKCINSVRVEELCTEQEEADTRVLLHASHMASQGYRCIIIRSPDTDIAVLACSFSHDIDARLLFWTGTKQRQRYLDATAIGNTLGSDVSKALLGMHALTGCDSTSAFIGRGKKKKSIQADQVRPDHV